MLLLWQAYVPLAVGHPNIIKWDCKDGAYWRLDQYVKEAVDQPCYHQAGHQLSPLHQKQTRWSFHDNEDDTVYVSENEQYDDN